MNRYVTSRLAGEQDRIRDESEKEPFYLEHFSADLTTTDSHDVYHLAAERARDWTTPSQPSREVRRQAGEYPCEVSLPGAGTVLWGVVFALIGSLAIWALVP